jgi:uncharacterized protein YbjT (DUF2867 family)
MKIAIVGATSGTGRAFVDMAIEVGHEVVALARRPDALAAYGGKITVRQADVRDPAALTAALEGGADVMIALFGASGLFEARKVEDLYSVGTKNVIGACRARGIRRLVSVSSSGVEAQENDPWIFRAVLKPLFLENMYKDMLRMEASIIDSELDWTIVRPPYLTNGPLTKGYRIRKGSAFADDKSLSRRDLAHFLLRASEEEDWSTSIVVLSD